MPRKKKEGSKATSSTSEKVKKPAKNTAPKKTKTTRSIKAVKKPKAAPAKKAPASKGRETASASKLSAWKKLPRIGETQMVAFIRDPRCIFTYWEVSPESVESVKKQLMEEYPGSSMALRVFKVHPDGNTEMLYEVDVEPGDRNRYLDLKEPGGKYYVEVVQKTASGRVVTYTRSNLVSTSQESLASSSSSDLQWAPPAGILEYFNDGEEKGEFFVTPVGLSSAESLRRKKSKWDSYHASRVN
jgi:hypothetical protein